MKNLPLFIDFEASGLSEDSYPIEVGWNDENGEIFSHLINVETIKEWTHWDEASERDAHKLSLDSLERLGDPPSEVAERLNKALAGKTLFSDALNFDQFWLDRLYNAVEMKPTFQLANATDLFFEIFHKDHKKSTDAIHVFYGFMDAKAEEIWAKINLRPHRASHDVCFLLEAYKYLLVNEGRY